MVLPTAVQAVMELHDTARRRPRPRPGWIDQLAPFRRLTSAKYLTLTSIGLYAPTAVHVASDVHDAPESW